MYDLKEKGHFNLSPYPDISPRQMSVRYFKLENFRKNEPVFCKILKR